MLNHTDGLYQKDIAFVQQIQEKSYTQKADNTLLEPMKLQTVTAVLTNGTHKDESIHFTNKVSYSGVNDLHLHRGDKVFVSLQITGKNKINSVRVIDFKRDNYLGYIAAIFIFCVLWIGGKKGIRSLASILTNIMLFLTLLFFFTENSHLLLYACLFCVLFIVLSLVIVIGVHPKSIAAIISTLISTAITLIIALTVASIYHWQGVHFEEIADLISLSPERIFLVELLLGTLGATMDIAISLSSSIYELCESNPSITKKDLIASSKRMGQDIMETMTNTLLFAYLGGSIPTLLLLIRNGINFSLIFPIYLSMEITRALVGGIGIVLTIPIATFIAIFIFRKKQKAGDIRA